LSVEDIWQRVTLCGYRLRARPARVDQRSHPTEPTMTCEVCGNTKSPAAIVARHAESLVRQHPRHALFFAHLSLERYSKPL